MYRMDTHGADEVAAQDPFSGRGLFLPHPGNAQEIMGALEKAFGIVPAVTWPERGAWVDAPGAGISAAEISSRWEAAAG